MVAVLDKRMARNDIAVKVDAEVVKRARIVATHRGITLAEYISDLLQEPTARDYRAALDEMSGAMPERSPKPKKGGA